MSLAVEQSAVPIIGSHSFSLVLRFDNKNNNDAVSAYEPEISAHKDSNLDRSFPYCTLPLLLQVAMYSSTDDTTVGYNRASLSKYVRKIHSIKNLN